MSDVSVTDLFGLILRLKVITEVICMMLKCSIPFDPLLFLLGRVERYSLDLHFANWSQ